MDFEKDIDFTLEEKTVDDTLLEDDSEIMESPRDIIKRKLHKYFDGKIARKDLTIMAFQYPHCR